MLRASHEMGFGDDWKKALEAVKNKYVEPGQMIYLVRDLSHEAIDFVEKHELVTIPDLVKQDYWEEAMTPEGQLTAPFFLGGAVIQVSSPASSQTIEQRIETLRGNNIYFARATVFHELVPGHHMQQYMTQRYRTYRGLFSTPFWTEGMAFYWEMLMWDLGFTNTPEPRGRPVLAHAPLRAHHLFTELPPKQNEGHRMRPIPRGPRRFRKGQCGRRSAAVVRGVVRADLSMRLHAGRARILCPA
jgi:hypothetical protein